MLSSRISKVMTQNLFLWEIHSKLFLGSLSMYHPLLSWWTPHSLLATPGAKSSPSITPVLCAQCIGYLWSKKGTHPRWGWGCWIVKDGKNLLNHRCSGSAGFRSASTPPGNLLEIKITRLQLRVTESESVRWEAAFWVLTGPRGDSHARWGLKTTGTKAHFQAVEQERPIIFRGVNYVSRHSE